MDKTFSVSSIIDKLPSSWQDFKHTLKHKKEDMNLNGLGSHLRIEESIWAQDSGKRKGKEVGSSINMIEDKSHGNKYNKKSNNKKRNFDGNKNASNKKDKKSCWRCGKSGHYKLDCKVKMGEGGSTSSAGQGSKDPTPNQGQISDFDDTIGWWVDSGATCHACKDRE
ncbi:uncharacterized protein [Rutidosis leptorrhynchoides]|uniref:uncharacterized protein n=1 Tax=Rutidosis leptorrhynchoides TaxID=125765 RepID=UPI003A997B68